MSKSNEPSARGRGRDPKKESFWRERLRHQTRSGLTVRGYCEREALKEASFYFWRREIGRRDSRSAGRQTPAPVFVEVHAAPLPAAVVTARPELVCPEPVERESPLELVFPDDRRLLIRAGCDAALLARVVAVLAAAGLPKGEAKPC